MTYSGLLMLVIGVARRAAAVRPRDRAVGGAGDAGAGRGRGADLHAQRLGRRLRRGRACCSSLKDFRLLAILPIVAAIIVRLAPARRSRSASISMFDVKDPTSRDRVAMLREGAHMIAPSADRRRPEHGRSGSTRSTATRRPSSRSTRTCTTCRCRLPPSAACRRSASGPWFIVVAGARPAGRCCAPSRHAVRWQPAALAADRGDARRRALRIQLRRLRVPDAVPAARHAAVRRRRDRPAVTAPHRRCRRSAPIARATLVAGFAGVACSSSATSCSTSSWSAA